ncbi:hypothetical protein [Arthrobacter sp. ISL-30]|uniref:hypothetical protein n=1 Tax=Arthrobacter sp. ISL-30 TaxID=2819109 RepID=UPI001BE71DBD|nr:hypothetical protein [Arthrobacter sp. ISL-30]MBT2515363.1 hypothetical protein [Arthrobacter sp. ISL-30]
MPEAKERVSATRWQFPSLLTAVLTRLRAAMVPYGIGDCVVTDDPFVGRIEGIVELKQGNLVGLRTLGDDLVLYDYRMLRLVE